MNESATLRIENALLRAKVLRLEAQVETQSGTIKSLWMQVAKLKRRLARSRSIAARPVPTAREQARRKAEAVFR